MDMPDKIPRQQKNQPKTRGQLPELTLQQWLATTREFNRAGAEFLKVDAETGLTLARVALSTPNGEKKRRNQKSARKAYDTILRLLKRITPTDADARELNIRLHELKDDLIQLGEVF